MNLLRGTISIHGIDEGGKTCCMKCASGIERKSVNGASEELPNKDFFSVVFSLKSSLQRQSKFDCAINSLLVHKHQVVFVQNIA